MGTLFFRVALEKCWTLFGPTAQISSHSQVVAAQLLLPDGLSVWTVSFSPNNTLPPPSPPSSTILPSPQLVNVPAFSKDALGMVYHAHVVPDSYADPKHCLPDGSLKPCRPRPQIRACDFFGSLVQVEGRWIFPTELNSWPALKGLELKSITTKVRDRMGIGHIQRLWDAAQTSHRPVFPAGSKGVRVTLHAPLWTGRGWSSASPGFVFWAALQPNGSRRVTHGEDMVRAVLGGSLSDWEGADRKTQAVRAHVFAHRYAKAQESTKDRLVWHTGVLLEWCHGLFTTVVELSWWNGIGGYGGKSNWVRDKDEGPTLFQAIPAGLKAPWRSDRCEIRVTDHPARSIKEFEGYLHEYSGDKAGARFLAPQIVQSADVLLSHRRVPDVMRYLLNYAAADKSYHEELRNCQTFTADFLAFLTGRKGTEPYHAIVRMFYTPRIDTFLYGPADG